MQAHVGRGGDAGGFGAVDGEDRGRDVGQGEGAARRDGGQGVDERGGSQPPRPFGHDTLKYEVHVGRRQAAAEEAGFPHELGKARGVEPRAGAAVAVAKGRVPVEDAGQATLGRRAEHGAQGRPHVGAGAAAARAAARAAEIHKLGQRHPPVPVRVRVRQAARDGGIDGRGRDAVERAHVVERGAKLVQGQETRARDVVPRKQGRVVERVDGGNPLPRRPRGRPVGRDARVARQPRRLGRHLAPPHPQQRRHLGHRGRPGVGQRAQAGVEAAVADAFERAAQRAAAVAVGAAAQDAAAVGQDVQAVRL